MPKSAHTINVLNSLIRGELAAIRTYTLALQIFPESSAAADWLDLREDHVESVDRLRELVLRQGGHPPGGVAHGNMVEPVMGNTPCVLGEDTAIAALVKGEEHGLSDYTEALADHELLPQVKKVLREELLPPLQFHLIALDRLTAAGM